MTIQLYGLLWRIGIVLPSAQCPGRSQHCRERCSGAVPCSAAKLSPNTLLRAHLLSDNLMWRFCHVSRRLNEFVAACIFCLCDLHDADGDAGVLEKVTASAGCRNVLVVTRSTAEEVAELIILAAKSVCRLMFLEAAHTSDAFL